jgi:glycosyltransferase involved in cell wall biosynthesis
VGHAARARGAITVTGEDSAPLDLSVVIPARNEVATITDQLDALTAQTWSGSWEVLVVDNGSTDATPDLVTEYGTHVPRVRLVRASERAGLNYARNTGIDASQGRSFALCDADDIVAPGWIAAMGDALRTDPLVTGLLELDRLNPEWLANSRGRGDERGLPTFHGIFPTVHGNNMGMQRDVWEALGRFDEDVIIGSDDVELSMRAWRAGVSVRFVPDAIVHYRYRPELRALWRQGRNYGRSRPLVVRRLREQGLECPNRLAGWRSWAWLVRHVPDLRTEEGRAAWTWVSANRLGQVEGSFRYRSLFL